MWETQFNPAMLDARTKFIINCPTEESERELASILASCGVAYLGGKNPVNIPCWNDYQERFCYYVDGKDLYRGVRSDTDVDGWHSSIKCTFLGVEQPDFNVATDNELQSLFEI